MFGDPWPGVVYTNHDYADPGFVDGQAYPGISRGRYYDNEVLQEVFLKRSQYMLDHKLPIWVGEFGPVYTGDPAADAMRYRVLRDQLETYRHYGASWSIWLYKDIGLQAVVHAASDSPWVERLRPFLAKKARLGADAWGSRDTEIRHLLEPLERTFASEFPQYQPGPFGVTWQISRLVRHILLSEALLPEFGGCFAGLREAELDDLLRSFLFAQCTVRQELATILSEYAC